MPPEFCRHAIRSRWLALMEDVIGMENATKSSPPGTLTPEELDETEVAVDRIWQEITGEKPKPQQTARERRKMWERRWADLQKRMAEVGPPPVPPEIQESIRTQLNQQRERKERSI